MDTPCTVNLPPFRFLKKIKSFPKKNPSVFFVNKKQILNALRYLTVSIEFYGKLVTRWCENFSRSESVLLIVEHRTLSIGKHRVKNVRLEWMIVFHILNMGGK